MWYKAAGMNNLNLVTEAQVIPHGTWPPLGWDASVHGQQDPASPSATGCLGFFQLSVLKGL